MIYLVLVIVAILGLLHVRQRRSERFIDSLQKRVLDLEYTSCKAAEISGPPPGPPVEVIREGDLNPR